VKHQLRFTVLGIVAYLVFLLVTLPAAYAYGVLASRLAPLSLYGVGGSIWSGTAEAARVRDFTAQDIRWHVQPLALFRAALEVDVRLRTGGETVSGLLGRRLNHALYAADVDGSLPVDILIILLHLSFPPQSLDGTLLVKLDRLVIKDGIIQEAAGSITWKDASVSITTPVSLGDVQMHMQNTDQGVLGTLRDQGGPLEVRCRVQLASNGRYRIMGTLRARSEAPSELIQALRYAGTPAADGAVSIDREGILKL
jgi:Bacterial type II secretion system protein N.